jgi:hypothetical protein
MVCFVFIPPISRPFVLLNWELLQIIIPSLKNTKVIALSVDGLESHINGLKILGNSKCYLQYPIIGRK